MDVHGILMHFGPQSISSADFDDPSLSLTSRLQVKFLQRLGTLDGNWCAALMLFPTCQVRVVRFYQSCCPPPSPPPPLPPPVSPRPCLHQLPPPLPPCQLFAKLFANFRAQCALLDLNLGPSQLSAHCWTSTWDLPSSVHTAGPQWDLPSSVRTAGPQPGTFPAQCAPLDLNLGPSQLSAHRWTSTWDLPSSVRLDLNLGPSKLSAHHWTSTAR